MAKLPSSSSSFALDFLRRLLCAHTTGGGNANTTAPRDAPEYLQAPEPEGEGRSPCIVARLMGLDAMPPPPPEPAHPQQQPLRRSRSASSVESGGTSPSGLGDATPAAKAVRPSASLREKPAYLRAENDMFLLLSFSPEAEGDRDAAKKADYDERRRVDAPDGERGGSRKQRRPPHRRKLQFGGGDDECSQASSPVSVLDAQHEDSSTTTTSCSLDDVDTHSEDVHLFASEQQSISSSARRTPHRTSFDDDDGVSPATTSTVVHASGRRSDRERRNGRRTAVTGKSDASTAPDVSGVWQPVCRLVEEDLKTAEWLPTRRLRACALSGVVVVAEEMGSEILDQLVREATAELVRLCSDAPCDSPVPSSSMPEKGSGSKKHSGRTKVPGHY